MSDQNDGVDKNRRRLIAGIAGIGLVSSFSAGRVSAQTAPDGFVGTPTNPYLRAYVDRKSWVGRTSDPSSPEEGTEWFRSDV